MEGFCSCGARLVEDALFCHRCGKPQRDLTPAPEEEPIAAEEPVAAAPAAPMPAVVFEPVPPQEVNFRNGAAVRVGFFAAAMMQLLTMLSAAFGIFPVILPLILLGGGYFSVALYRRRTGQGLSVVNGARIGWITGVFAFVIMTVFFTLSMAAMAGTDELMKAYRESAASFRTPPEAIDQMQKMLNDPSSLALGIVFSLGLVFVLLTLVCSLGGALGARIQPRR